MNDSERMWISGLIPVRATIEGGNRDVFHLLIQDDRLDGATARLQQLARDRGIPFERVSRDTIRSKVEHDPHGGVIAEAGSRRFLTLGDLLDNQASAAIFMLDGIEDPYNLGQALRSLYASGATGIVLRPRNWLTATETVIRSSAGAVELMPIAVAGDAQAAAGFYRAGGLTVIAATQTNAVPIHDVNLTDPFFLVVGGEKRGLSRAFEREADIRVSIPYGRPFAAALGAAAASAVLGFEVLRQRRGLPSEG